MKLTQVHAVVSAFVTSLLIGSAAAAQPRYSITDLGTLPDGNRHFATRINASGQVVGISTSTVTDSSRTFLWSEGTLADIGTLPGITHMEGVALNAIGDVAGRGIVPCRPCSHAFLYTGGTLIRLELPGWAGSASTALNTAGDVVGFAWNYEPTRTRAFIRRSGTTSELSPLPGGNSSVAYAVNDAGDVAGGSQDALGVWHAVVWSNGSITDLGTFGTRGAVAWGINAAGQVMGRLYVPAPGGGSSVVHAFLYGNGTGVDLGTFGGLHTFPNDLNEAGDVVGEAHSGPDPRAFLYSGGSMTDLGTFSGFGMSLAYAINSAGYVVGRADSSAGRRAFVYRERTLHKLDDLIPVASGWHHLAAATDINDAGQIVGWGVKNGQVQTSAFRLDPIP